MPIPSINELKELTVQALVGLGGSARIQEIADEVAKILSLSAEEINKPQKGHNMTQLKYRLAWARTYLKEGRLLVNSSRGVWALASGGANAGQTEKATASAALAIPSINKLKELTVQALGNLGGSAESQKIEDEVARLAGVTKKDRNDASATTGRHTFSNRLATAKTHLKNDGKIVSSARGVWALASGGAAVRPEQGVRAKSNGPHGAQKPTGANAGRDNGDADADALHRVQKALVVLQTGLAPYVAEKMQTHYGDDWRRSASRAVGDEAGSELDLSGLLKTILDNPGDVFQDFQRGRRLRKAHTFVHASLHARNTAAHFKGAMPGREALRHLDAVHELLAAVGAGEQAKIVERLHEEQQRANLK